MHPVYQTIPIFRLMQNNRYYFVRAAQLTECKKPEIYNLLNRFRNRAF